LEDEDFENEGYNLGSFTIDDPCILNHAAVDVVLQAQHQHEKDEAAFRVVAGMQPVMSTATEKGMLFSRDTEAAENNMQATPSSYTKEELLHPCTNARKFPSSSKGKGRVRAYTGLLQIGSDLLRYIAKFMSWEMKRVRAWSGHSAHILDVCFSPNSQHLLTSSSDHSLKLWSTGGELVRAFGGHVNGVRRCCFVPSGAQVLSASLDHSSMLWNTEGIDAVGPQARLEGHKDYVFCCDISRCGKHILTGSNDSTLKIWCRAGDAEAPALQHTVQVRSVSGGTSSTFAYCCQFSPDGAFFLAGCNDSSLKVHTFNTAMYSIP
jgi:WD40 repeat protein